MDPITPKFGKRHPWTRKQISMLGKISDAQLARQLDLTVGTVLKKRQKLGLPGTRPCRTIAWTPSMIAMLGKFPDGHIAETFRINKLTVYNKRLSLGIKCYARGCRAWHRWTQKEIAVLGKMSDADAALKLGFNKASVAWKRSKLKIPPFGERYANKRPPKPLNSWTRKEISVLGTMTDAQAAEKLNLAHSTVYKKRVSLGIPPHGRKKS